MTPNFAAYVKVEQELMQGGDGLTALKCPECGRTGRFVSMRVKCPGKHPARMMLAVPISRKVWG